MSAANDNLRNSLIDLVEEHFPKGQASERGEAMVLIAEALLLFESERRQAAETAVVDYLQSLRRKAYVMEAAGMQLSVQAEVWNQLELLEQYHLNDEYEKLYAKQRGSKQKTDCSCDCHLFIGQLHQPEHCTECDEHHN